jgi:hypothetical protein
MTHRIFFKYNVLTMYLTSLADNLILEWSEDPTYALEFDEHKAEALCNFINQNDICSCDVQHSMFF